MPVDTRAINSIIEAYLKGVGIRTQREAEATRQKERGEDIKREEERFQATQDLAQKRFDIEKANAEINRIVARQNIQEGAVKLGGTPPPGSTLTGTQYDETGQYPLSRSYDIQGMGPIEIPDVGRLSYESAQREADALRMKLGTEEPFKAGAEERKFTLDQIIAAQKHQYDLELERERNKGKLAGKTVTDVSDLARYVMRDPDSIKLIGPKERAQVFAEIQKSGLNFIPSAVRNSLGFLQEAQTQIQNIKNTKGFTGALGGLTVPGTQTRAMANYIQSLKASLVIPRLDYMRGLGHMSDREFNNLSASITALDQKSPTFAKDLGDIENAVTAKVKELQTRLGQGGPGNINPDTGTDLQDLINRYKVVQ